MKRILLFSLLVVLGSCFNEPQEIGEVQGLKPIYLPEEAAAFEITSSIPFGNLGKIVYAEPFILINERYKGIHIINNMDPENPEKVSFVQIPGNTDFTIKSGYLYANSGVDLVTYQFDQDFSASSLEDFELEQVNLKEEFFGVRPDTRVPPDYNGFFECVDVNGGIVVGWESTIIINPECRT